MAALLERGTADTRETTLQARLLCYTFARGRFWERADTQRLHRKRVCCAMRLLAGETALI